MWRSACNPYGDRKTMAVRDCHDLAPFAAACWTNSTAPFFAPEKEASINVSVRSKSPRVEIGRVLFEVDDWPKRTPRNLLGGL
jgi:hypothetical protein